MTIEIFVLLEQYKEQILNEVNARVQRELSSSSEISADVISTILDHVFERYEDFLITDDLSTLTGLYEVLSPPLLFGDRAFAIICEAPLMIAASTRSLLVENYSNTADEETILQLREALDITERTAYRATGRWLDMLHQAANEKPTNRQKSLQRAQEEFNIDLSSFWPDREENQSV